MVLSSILCWSAIWAADGDVPLAALGRFDLDCPVCRLTFTTAACTQTDARGGVDRDLFAQAVGPQPDFYLIATCPRCGYSGYPADFNPDVSLPPDVRDKILREPKLKLPAGFTPQSDPRELDAADRYALAITCYGWRKRSDEAMAWLYLRSSWVAREEGSMLPPDGRLAKVMAFIERWRPAMKPTDNQLDIEMQLATRVAEAIEMGQFNRYQRPYVELALALIFRRHGENVTVSPFLERLAEYERFSAALREGISQMRESISRERRFQTQAAEHFERSLLADQISKDNRGSACYLLAELCRRLDRDSEAAEWYHRALADPQLPANLKPWAQGQLERCTKAR